MVGIRITDSRDIVSLYRLRSAYGEYNGGMQINVVWLYSFVQEWLKHRRRALSSNRARYDVIEFSNCHTEERSEAEMASYRAP